MKQFKHLICKTSCILFASLMLCANTIPVYARSSSTSVINHGTIGAVDIELHQKVTEEQVMLLPNQTVSIESSVENKGEPAWIRVKLEYPAAHKMKSEIDENRSTVTIENTKIDRVTNDEADEQMSEADEKLSETESSEIKTEQSSETKMEQSSETEETEQSSETNTEQTSETKTEHSSETEQSSETKTEHSSEIEQSPGIGIEQTSEYSSEATEQTSEDAALKDTLQSLDDSLITFADGNWTKIGDYYYQTEPAETGKTIPFTESITFPSDWDNCMTNTQMGIVFTAEAIQETNFKPDFNSDDPWHGAVIEAFDSDNYQPKTKGNEQFSIIYKDGSEGLIHVGDDFFANWENLMPGDELDGTAEIINKMNLPVKISFEMKNEGDSKLLEMITITIKNGNDLVYDGPLSGTIHPAVLLHEYQTNESSEFTYHLSVSSDVNNAHALADFKSVWTFSAEEVPPPDIPKTIPEKIIRTIEYVKTGEYDVIPFILSGLLIAVPAGVLIVSKRHKKGDA